MVHLAQMAVDIMNAAMGLTPPMKEKMFVRNGVAKSTARPP